MGPIKRFFFIMGTAAFMMISLQIVASKYLFNDGTPYESNDIPRYWSHLDNLIPTTCSPSSHTIQTTYKHYVTRNSHITFSISTNSQNLTWTNPSSGTLKLSATQKNDVWFTYQPKKGFLGCDSFEVRLGTSSTNYISVQLYVVFGPSLTQGVLDVPQNYRIAQMSLFETSQVFAQLQQPSLKRHIVAQDSILESRFRTCAVVGNGGVLKGRLHGNEIDEHEVVFRFNARPVSKFSRDVGSKLTFMFSAADRARVCWTLTEEPSMMKQAHTVFVQISDLAEYQKCAENFEENYPHIQFNLISYEWMMLADEIIREYIGDDRNNTESKLRSTGMLAFMAAAISCDQIKLYGFKDHVGYHHYWDEHPGDSSAWGRHSYSAEQEFYHDVATENYAKFEQYLWPYQLSRDIVFVTN